MREAPLIGWLELKRGWLSDQEVKSEHSMMSRLQSYNVRHDLLSMIC